METKTEHHQLNVDLILHDSSSFPLTIHTITLSLTKQNDKIIECRLTLFIPTELYHRIDTEALFNLKPEVRTPLTNGDFQPSPDIEMEVILKPDLFPLLLEHITNADELATYLFNLSQQPKLTSESNNESSDNPKSPNSLLLTESWLVLSVKQQQESGETGYRTFWSYVSPKNLSGSETSSEEVSESITNFFKDLITGSFNLTAKELANETIGVISNFFQELTQDNTAQESTSTQPIFQEIINFFTQDDWSFTKNQGELTLYLGFEGQNGTWNCYAIAREEEEQFIFYSICPFNIPETQRIAVSEFITRANFGIVIGNFELDFRDGQIRYKTSIDVENNQLNFAVIKQLVYANVRMMDEYLPGIISIINNDLSPEVAINQIEEPPDNIQSSTEQEEPLVLISTNDDQSSQLTVNQLPHILSILTPEEIGQFHEISEMVAPYQRKKVEEKSQKLQKLIIARLGDLGTEIFSRASAFFLEYKLAAKNLKLIQRYSGLAGRTRLLCQNFENWHQQDGELSIKLEIRTAILELQWLQKEINERLYELPTEKFPGRKEVELLMEIEEFREKLNLSDKLLKKWQS